MTTFRGESGTAALRVAIALLALLAPAACLSTRWSRLHLEMRGSDRSLVVEADETTDPPQVSCDGDAFVVAMSHRVLRLEKAALLLDEAVVASYPADARTLLVSLEKRRLSIRADGALVHELAVDD